MIREAKTEEKNKLYSLWKHAYPNQNHNYLNFYFQNIFDRGTCVVKEQDNKIISSIQMNEHVLMFHGKRLLISYLDGVSTLNDYRRRGHMHDLMNSVLDEACHNHLITLISAFHPKLYERYGFETVYYRTSYTILQDWLKDVTAANVYTSASAEELYVIYRSFIRHFDGAYVRDEEYYKILLEELKLQQKRLLVYRNAQGKACGYLLYRKKRSDVIVEEVVYLESITLMHMLKYAIGKEKSIVVEVSQGERLEKIFSLAIPRKEAYIMARINQIDLFNKLYNSHIRTAKEAYALLQKPLWIHEYY